VKQLRLVVVVVFHEERVGEVEEEVELVDGCEEVEVVVVEVGALL
jgi:translation elongation factor EF-1beta